METNHYEQERRAKLEKLRALGVDPYGQRTAGLTPLAEAKATYKPEMGHDAGPDMKVAGRIMLRRGMGKLSFMTLRDETGDLQVAIDKKRVDEKSWAVNDLLDLGDQIIVDGKLGVTNKGEITVWATNLTMASKALLPPPAKWDGLQDVELRYRQRYVDLWANPEVMRLAKLRIAVIDEMRSYLRDRGFTEVETPMMQIQPGGATARPFVTHHNALDIPLYMRIAPELFLKRLLVGGMGKIFEINRNFRNEGISPRHNPEFTMLEAYEAYGSWETMADLVEGMICHIAEKLFGGLKIIHRGGAEGGEDYQFGSSLAAGTDGGFGGRAHGWKFDKQPANQSTFRDEDDSETDIFNMYGGSLYQAYDYLPESERRAKVDQGVNTFASHFAKLSPAEQLVEVYEKLIEPTLIDPCYVTHVPSVIIPLAKKNAEDPFFADVYELAINGVEISPGYSELNDPEIQAANFSHQVGDEAEKQKMDDDFLNALRYGMPPAGGLGLGIDRLIMMLTGAESIRDVILFPLMRPN